eukprot:2742977-Rhodomonas_salina.2
MLSTASGSARHVPGPSHGLYVPMSHGTQLPAPCVVLYSPLGQGEHSPPSDPSKPGALGTSTGRFICSRIARETLDATRTRVARDALALQPNPGVCPSRFEDFGGRSGPQAPSPLVASSQSGFVCHRAVDVPPTHVPNLASAVTELRLDPASPFGCQRLSVVPGVLDVLRAYNVGNLKVTVLDKPLSEHRGQGTQSVAFQVIVESVFPVGVAELGAVCPLP